MTFTLTLPTWRGICDMFLLLVFYYSSLVAPQYDWIIFCGAYYLGLLVAMRTPYRMYKGIDNSWRNEDRKHYVGWSAGEEMYWFFCVFLLSFLWPISLVINLSILLISIGNGAKKCK